MQNQVRILELFQPLFFSVTGNSEKLSCRINPNETLITYTTAITKRDMNPDRTKYLTLPQDRGTAVLRGQEQTDQAERYFTVPAGKYLFIQGRYTSHEAVINAAEALHLELVWRELEAENMTIYLRLLKEEETVFQLFRKLR